MATPITVDAYLAALPADRREALQTVRDVINRNLPPGYEEGIQYGAIGWYVPHSRYPEGYHCKPRQPLPFGGLASRKQAMSLSFMCMYGDTATRKRFLDDWKKTGKKLDMGAACITFKRVEDLALDVIADTLSRATVAEYVRQYEQMRDAPHGKPRKARPKKTSKSNAKARTSRARRGDQSASPKSPPRSRATAK